MPAMDAPSLDELRALRARAYGPHADIARDPAAMRRLDELEARLVGGSAAPAPVADESELAAPPDPDPATGAPDPAAGAPDPAAGAREPIAGDHAAAAGAPDAAAGAAEARPALTTRVKLLWAFTVVAAVAIAVSITCTLTYFAPVSVSSGARQVATLEPSRAVVPTGWGGAGPSSLTWEYAGLVAFETMQGYGVPGGENCFAVVPAEQIPEEIDANGSWSSNGAYWLGCSVGGFPATVEVLLDSSVPAPLREGFPDGSVLQFARDGDRVGVFAWVPADA